MLVDLHCHILPGIDDGAKDLDTALEMCKIAENDGVENIIATPHYIQGAYNNTCNIVQHDVAELNKHLKEQNINVTIYPGCEAFISPELPSLVKKGVVCTLNNTQYILLELPMASFPEYTLDVVYQLKLDGFIPIIAHPERNLAIAKNPDLLFDLINRGALSQINSTSVKGLFGSDVKSTAIKLLEHNMVHFMSSDAHTTGGRSPKVSSAMNIIKDKLGSDTLDRLISNSEAVLAGEAIEIEEPIKPRTASKISFIGGLSKLFTNGIFK